MCNESIGLDFSRWDGKINWSVVKSRKPDFIIMRSSYAGHTLDPLWLTDNKVLGSYPGVRGVYHVPSPDKALNIERSILDLVIQHEPSPDIVALDLEIYHGSLPKRALDLAYHVEDNYNLPVFIYTNVDFRNKYTAQQFPKELFKFPLWVAHWTTKAIPLIPRGWDDYVIWQYSANGNKMGLEWGVSARDVDLNRVSPVYGSLAKYLAERVK